MNSINTTNFRSLDKLAKNRKVKLIYQDEDGIFVELHEGWGVNECISYKAQNCQDALYLITEAEEYYQ